MVIVGQQAELPVRLVTAAGANATGIVAADILNGVAQFVKSNNTKNNITLSNGSNWLEIDSVQSPGLYHIIIPFGVNSVVGPIQYTIYPTAAAFTAFVGADYAMDAPAKEATSTAIKAKTDLITADPATETTSLAIKAKTDLLPGIPASQGDVTSGVTSTISAIRGNENITLTAMAGGTGFVSNTDNLHAIRQAIGAGGTSPWDELVANHLTSGTFGEAVRLIKQACAGDQKIDTVNFRLQILGEDKTTVIKEFYLLDENNQPSINNVKIRKGVT